MGHLYITSDEADSVCPRAIDFMQVIQSCILKPTMMVFSLRTDLYQMALYMDLRQLWMA
jgi:hypothetical protein